MSEKIEIRHAQCYMSHFNCGLLVTIKDGKVVKIEGDPDHPTNRGRICLKPKHAIEIHYHPLRLNYPLKRVGQRGENKWQRISWDQALHEIAAKLKEVKEKYGAEAVAHLQGTAREDHWEYSRFMNLFGSPNRGDPATHCFGNDFMIEAGIIGWHPFLWPVPGVTKCLLQWAHNVAEMGDYPEWWLGVDCLKAGAKLICIDPRCTEIARQADLWLQPRPGSDGALALAFLNVIMNEGMYDKEIVEKWTNAPFLIRADTNKIVRGSDIKKGGDEENFVVWDSATKSPQVWMSKKIAFEKPNVKPVLIGTFKITLANGEKVDCKTVWSTFLDYVNQFSPETVEKITWVPKEKIIQAARMYATLKPGLMSFSQVHDCGTNATDMIRFKAILRLIVGNWDVEGGEIWVWIHPRLIPEVEMELQEMMPPEQRKKQLGSDRFRLNSWPGYELVNKYQNRISGREFSVPGYWQCLAHTPTILRAIVTGKPYPVKALIVTSANPMVTVPNTKLVYKALKAVDFLVVHDKFMTPTAMLADYVLPAADMLERSMLFTAWGCTPALLFGQKSLEPRYERRDDYDFWRGLGIRLGQEKYWPWKTKDECYEYRVKPLGWTYKDLEAIRYDFPPMEFKKYEKVGFPTPSGRGEIYSIIFENLGYNPLPVYVEPFEGPVSTPELTKEYPLILITGARHQPYFHSEYRQIESMRRMRPDPLLEIHPDVARELDPPVADGDWVWIETPRGRVRQKAYVTPAIHPRVVSAEHGWWFPEQPREEPFLFGVYQSNINICTDDEPDNCDPECGSESLRVMLCKVYKAEPPKRYVVKDKEEALYGIGYKTG